MKNRVCLLLAILTLFISKIGIGQNDILLIDGHSHMGLRCKDNSIELSDTTFLKRKSIGNIFYSLPANKSFTNNLYEELFKEFNMLDSLFVNSEAKQKKSDLCFNFCIEYFNGLGGYNENTFIKLSEYGIKYFCLIDHKDFKIFNDGSLTNQGIDLIQKLNETNITIDITHLEEKEMLVVINSSKKPVIASHTCAKGIAELPYNISDKVIEQVAINKGLILVSFNRNGLFTNDEEPKDGVKRFCDHIDYIVKQVGIEYIGIGKDLQAEGKYVPADLRQSNSIREIEIELKRMGYNCSEIEQILNKNLTKFFKL